MAPAVDRAAIMSLAFKALSPGQETENHGAALMRALADLFNAVAALMEEAPVADARPAQPAPSPDQSAAADAEPEVEGEAADEWLTITQALAYMKARGVVLTKSWMSRQFDGYCDRRDGKHYPPKFTEGTDSRRTADGWWLVRRTALDRYIADRTCCSTGADVPPAPDVQPTPDVGAPGTVYAPEGLETSVGGDWMTVAEAAEYMRQRGLVSTFPQSVTMDIVGRRTQHSQVPPYYIEGVDTMRVRASGNPRGYRWIVRREAVDRRINERLAS